MGKKVGNRLGRNGVVPSWGSEEKGKMEEALAWNECLV